MDMRQLIVDFMEYDLHNYIPGEDYDNLKVEACEYFINYQKIPEDHFTNYEDVWQVYLQTMRVEGEWADTTVIMASSIVLNTKIMVTSPGLKTE